jgi:transposase-like protein
MTRRVLSPDTELEIQRLYATGLYSHRAIAEMLGVGETTVFRAVHRRPRVAEEEGRVGERAQQSLAKLRRMLAETPQGMVGEIRRAERAESSSLPIPGRAEPGALKNEVDPPARDAGYEE